LFVVFNFVDLKSFGEALRKVNAVYLLAGVLVLGLGLLVRGIAWRTLLEEQAPLKEVFLAINEGYLLNNILPFRLGEFGRAWLLGQRTGLNFWQVFSTIILERAFDIALSAGLLLATLPFVLGLSEVQASAVGAAVLVAIGMLTLHLLARYREKAAELVQRWGRGWSLVANIAERWLDPFFNGLVGLVDGRRFLRVLGWMCIVWFVTYLEYYFVLRAFIPEAPILWAAFGLGVLAFGASIPSSPATIGVFEAALVGALRVFSVDYSTAFAYAVTVHLINFLMSAILGGYGLSRHGLPLGQLYRRLRRGTEMGS
jgi:uncharacterized protein (TIRG00374 family)